jgi:hypothetical protein
VNTCPAATVQKPRGKVRLEEDFPAGNCNAPARGLIKHFITANSRENLVDTHFLAVKDKGFIITNRTAGATT